MEQPHSEKIVPLHEKPTVLDHTLDGPENDVYIDPAKEVKLLAKLDLAFTPVIMLVYLSCFLDRSNIGKHHSIHSLYNIETNNYQEM